MLSINQNNHSSRVYDKSNDAYIYYNFTKEIPDVALDANNRPHIVWDDTRNSISECVFIIDGSGSMGSEWGDMCVALWGGNFASGTIIQGLKELSSSSNTGRRYMLLYDGYCYPEIILNNPACIIEQPWRNTSMSGMTVAVYDIYRPPYLTAHHIQDFLKIGGLGQIGPVYHGEMRMEICTCGQILQQQTIINGIQMPQNSVPSIR